MNTHASERNPRARPGADALRAEAGGRRWRGTTGTIPEIRSLVLIVPSANSSLGIRLRSDSKGPRRTSKSAPFGEYVQLGHIPEPPSFLPRGLGSRPAVGLQSSGFVHGWAFGSPRAQRFPAPTTQPPAVF